MLNYLGISIYDLMLGIIEDSIGDIVGDFEDRTDELIGESFARDPEEVDLLGATMQLEPLPLRHRHQGQRF